MRIAIVDDRAEDRLQLRSYLEKLDPLLAASTQEYESGEAFLNAYAPERFSILFLDCCMKEISGMDAARAVRAAGDACHICFTTSSRDYAVEGYRVRAAGYLVKPYSYDRFAELMNLLKPQNEEPAVELPLGRAGSERLFLRHILWCESEGHHVLVHTPGLGNLVVRESMADLTERLVHYPQFLSCFRGCIVNLDQVRELNGSSFILLDGQRVPIRQRELPAITRAYAEYQFKKARGDR